MASSVPDTWSNPLAKPRVMALGKESSWQTMAAVVGDDALNPEVDQRAAGRHLPLCGENTAAYSRLLHEDLEILVAPALLHWAEDVQLDVKSFLFRKNFAVTVEHRHTAACDH